MTSITITPVEGLPEVQEGDDLARLIVDAAELCPDDVVVITQKVVSKAEGRVIAGVDRRAAALEESARVLRVAGDLVICETRHGFVCANAGVDVSNVEGDKVVLLPLDPDLSARRLRKRIAQLTGVDVAVIISDTFGRAWRLGQTNVAIGVAGLDPFVDYRGTRDPQGRELLATRIAIADELASAAEMVMGKTLGICTAVVRGAPVRRAEGQARDLIRPAGEDLFR